MIGRRKENLVLTNVHTNVLVYHDCLMVFGNSYELFSLWLINDNYLWTCCHKIV